eukprot:CAMPEP_0176381482 /NCGR_PEP_ID=MMETSP0126-20121128/31924_1 /TAXON_ID=141414 ORGANISM="Strombidinopsis acuminatum, Strain SPMC142" /NCGR_SAMPLE_ID=MMETSP0126 /ASSEMBLY_ACC=CAM_ASM_000229 /LENGTH=96 /DNA_ID=CAMNT_0017745347 /DNA_START=316 /DNA_END=606 /DNA_ORIENTATION=+
MGDLANELEMQTQLKHYKAEFEQISACINKYQPQAESQAKIQECQEQAAELDRKCKSDEIELKQKKLHMLISMIQDFRAHETNLTNENMQEEEHNQ